MHWGVFRKKVLSGASPEWFIPLISAVHESTTETVPLYYTRGRLVCSFD